MKRKLLRYLGIITAWIFMVSCAAGVDDTGLEYAPQMYHSVPYEPLTQIVDEDAGTWLDSNEEDKHGEFYNSNRYNNFKMNMRKPVPNTIKRGTLIQPKFGKDELEQAADTLESPFAVDDEDVVQRGKALYERFCMHCHGKEGNADGKVAEVYAGVANLNGTAYKEITEGHIFHVITYGKGLMGTHGSQISPKERWKIARYVKELQNAN